ncbi:hypothetical protein D3C73_1220820 [compost metagenome]
MRDVVGTGQVHVDHAAKFVFGQIPDARGGDDAGVVDQHVDAAQGRVGQFHRGLARDATRDVAVQVDAAIGQCAGAALGVGVVQHRDAGALRKKQVDDRRADATGVGAPRDHGALAGQ